MTTTNKIQSKTKNIFLLFLMIIMTFALTMSFSKIKVEPSIEVYEQGRASYYGFQFLGRKTACGDIFTEHEYTCAHKYLPFGTKIKVTNVDNNRSVIVRVNDRGPFVKGRIVDLSIQSAKELGLIQSGVANVQVEIVNQKYSSLGNVSKMEQIRVEDSYAYIDKKNTKLVDEITKLIQFNELEESVPVDTVRIKYTDSLDIQ